MTNQSSIKYITSLLDNPASISEGDQSSIALFRQTFPYFVPGRYLVALESHKKSPFSAAMLSAMQPYMGDWIMFCDFLQNGASSHMKYMPPVVDVQAGKVVDKKMVELPVTQPDAITPPPVKEEIPTAILHKDPVFVPPVATQEPETRSVLNVIEEDKISLSEEIQAAIINASVIEKKKPEEEDVSFSAEAPKAETVAEVPADAPVVAEAKVVAELPVTENIEVPIAMAAPAEEVPEVLAEAPQVEAPVAVHTEAPAAAVDVPVIVEVPFVAEPASVEAAVPAPEEAQPEPVAESTGHAPQGVVFEDQGYVQDQHTHSKPLILEPLPLVPMPMAVVIDEEVSPVTVAADEVVVVEEPETIEEPVVSAEAEDSFIYPDAVPEEEAVEILSDTADAESVAETREQDTLIFPIYTKDYFLQQGEKVSEEIPVEINELKETDESEEDTSLMVVMSFSEWLLHFKNSAEKQKEETKDQKALKTMWQKEKLAAAMEEENEEIPETVFEMAVNSISKEEGLASETLAEIYMKQGKYDKAIEMYKKLSLRNPQKNVYFARKIEEALKDKQS